MRTKHFRFIALIITLTMALTPLTMTACSLFGRSESDIQIIDSSIYTDSGYNGSSLNLVVKIRNKSSSTITTSFDVDIYNDGAFFKSTSSRIITLGAGEVGQVSSFTIISARYLYTNFTYKITKWNFY